MEIGTHQEKRLPNIEKSEPESSLRFFPFFQKATAHTTTSTAEVIVTTRAHDF
jgi:hypothetical protein